MNRPIWLVLLVMACEDTGAPKIPPSSDAAVAFHGGGCYPMALNASLEDMVFLTNPEWAPVRNGPVVDSPPMMIHGIAHHPHGDTGGDNPIAHQTSDVTAQIELDAADAWMAASGNRGFLEFEWENGSFPDWGWPGEGDRVVALGRWIFDCGHPGAQPGHCSASTATACILDGDCATGEKCVDAHFGYQSELHPPQAAAVLRSGRGAVIPPAQSAVPATRADVFVSANGGGAGDRCVLTHHEPPLDVVFSVNCYPLSQPVAPINGYDFRFDLPLPPRPAGAHAVWRVDDRAPDGGVAAGVDITAREDDAAPHLEVRVKMTEQAAGRLPTGYAATMFAGWSAPAAPALVHVRLTVDAVDVTNAEKPDPPVVRLVPGWRMQAAVNGEWQRLGGLADLTTPATVAQSVVFDQYLPPDGALHVQANGVSSVCIDSMVGRPAFQVLDELGLGDFAMCLLSTNPSIGGVDESLPGPGFGAGAHATPSQGAEDPSGSAYTLRYHVDIVP